MLNGNLLINRTLCQLKPYLEGPIVTRRVFGCTVTRVRNGWLVVVGFEIIPGANLGDHRPQVWWCTVSPTL